MPGPKTALWALNTRSRKSCRCASVSVPFPLATESLASDTSLLDVLQLIGVVEGAEERVLRPDHVDVERRRHERAVHHDGRSNAIDARRVHDSLVVHGERLRATLPGGVEDVGEIGGVADRPVDIARGDADVARIVQLDRDAVATERGETGGRPKLVDAQLELTLGARLGRRIALDLIELHAERREIRFQLVLLDLERARRIDEGRVVAD